MFPFSESPLSSVATFFQAYASVAAFLMMARTMANQIIPSQLRSYITTLLGKLLNPLSKSLFGDLTLIIDEKHGMSPNDVFEAAELYLPTRISPSTERLRVARTQQQKDYVVSIVQGEEITDKFENFQLKWRLMTEKNETQKDKKRYFKLKDKKRYFELSFHKKFKEMVLGSYLPYVEERAKEIRKQMKVVKLLSSKPSINLDHPSTFETLAMDPETKKVIMDDLDRFLGRKEFYKKVGKAWKRGYLLYGPPGTGKSSLIAAMANYLKFDVYDLDLTNIYSNQELRKILLGTSNQSILVIEDIDCSLEVQDRGKAGQRDQPISKLTLSGILNSIDGLWSSVGDERIFVFTTNHKDRLDPALLRPGRMDLHIHMSYCTVHGFRHLASKYHGIERQSNDSHNGVCAEIEELIEVANVTPAVVAEELMRSEDAGVALEGLLQLLRKKVVEGEEKPKNEKG